MTTNVERVRFAAGLASLVAQRTLLRPLPPRIGYLGGQGAGNIGDDVMLAFTRHILAPANVVPFAYPGEERRLAKVRLSGTRYFRSVLLGGGTLINAHWADQVRTALDLEIPVWTLGTGVGSSGFGMPMEVNIDEWGPILRQVQRIGVRGPLSRNRLVALGLGDRVEIVGDLALGLARDRTVRASDPPKVAINLALHGRPDLQGGVPNAEKGVVTLVSRLRRRGFQPVLVAMHPTDASPLGRLANALGLPDSTVNMPRTGDEFFRLVEDCLFIITVRLHAGVLACCAGVPALMLAYRDKCIDFMESMDLRNWCLDVRAAQVAPPVDELGQSLIDQAPAMRKSVLKRAQSWKRALMAYVKQASSLYSNSPAAWNSSE